MTAGIPTLRYDRQSLVTMMVLAASASSMFPAASAPSAAPAASVFLTTPATPAALTTLEAAACRSSSIHVLQLFRFEITHCCNPLFWRSGQTIGGCVAHRATTRHRAALRCDRAACGNLHIRRNRFSADQPSRDERLCMIVTSPRPSHCSGRRLDRRYNMCRSRRSDRAVVGCVGWRVMQASRPLASRHHRGAATFDGHADNGAIHDTPAR